MGGIKVQDKFVWVWCYTVVRVGFPQSMKLSRRGFTTVEFLWEDLSLGRKGELGESLSLHLLLLKCLQLKIINKPKQRILRWIVLNSYSHSLE